jgi:hypothetical protein
MMGWICDSEKEEVDIEIWRRTFWKVATLKTEE